MESARINFDLRGLASELKERLISVPIYQRSYAWTKEEISEYWEDLRSAFAEGTPEYFMGTIVFTQKDDGGRHSVIDGQQRLATTSILLAAIRDEYKYRDDLKRAEIVQNAYLSTSDLGSAEEISRLNLNSVDSYFYDQRIVQARSTPEPTKESHELIDDAYKYFRTHVSKVADDAGPEWPKRLSQWVDFLKERLKCISLEVPTEADAFLIFETLNDRGADLTIADLLKNFLFGRAGSKLDAVRDSWMQVLGALEISAENSFFTTFLRHYWSSVHGAVRERELYTSIKDHVASQAQVVGFLHDLQKAANLYAALLNSDHEHWDGFGGTARENVQTLLRLDLEQNRPLLLAALQHFTVKEKKKLLRSLVSWSVRGLIVGGIGGGTAEKNYCRAAVKIRDGDIKTTSEVLQEITSIVPTDNEFRASFQTARVPKSNVARYYLLALERYSAGEKEPELVPNSNEDQVNLEHVLPKRAKKSDWGKNFDDDECSSYLHRMGNLALLQKGPNGRVGNRPFSAKRPILAKSKFKLTSEVAVDEDWTKAGIEQRQDKLTELALKTWPRS